MSIPPNLIFNWFVRLIVAFTVLPIHEYAHAFVADKLGDSTARYQGRLTINPFSHLDIIGTVLLVLAGFGWGKPVPINPRNFKNQKLGIVLSSAAGPLSNFLFSFVSLAVSKIIFYTCGVNEVAMIVSDVFGIIASVNITLAIFNFLPIPPLDGYRILSVFLPYRIYRIVSDYEQYIMIGLFLLIWCGVLTGPLLTLQGFFYNIMFALTGFIDQIFISMM